MTPRTTRVSRMPEPATRPTLSPSQLKRELIAVLAWGAVEIYNRSRRLRATVPAALNMHYNATCPPTLHIDVPTI
eukprot:6296446-Prymnesium_polylepis.1